MIQRACILLLLLMVAASAAATAPAPDPVVEYELVAGVQARLRVDGVVELALDDGERWSSLLEARWPLTASRRHDLPEPFTARAREGDPGGRRGFSRFADDDGDGLVDEDALDGRDNDGDGLIDEDHAAISHLMGIWDLTQGDRGHRLETYHWTYPHLSGLMIAVYSQHGGGVVENLRFELAGGASWRRVDEVCPLLLSGARAPQFVARIEGVRPHGGEIWLGAVLLDLEPRHRAGMRVRVDDDVLVVPLMDAYQAVAFVAGPTRLRVVQDLQSAISLQDGVVDPLTGQRVRWLPPVVQTELPTDLLPKATLQPAGADRSILVFDVAPEQYRRWDPDLFQLDDQPLGPAVELIWRDSAGHHSRRLSWPGPGGGRDDACQPYEALGVSGAGTLEIVLGRPAPDRGNRLTAVLVDGRQATLPVVLELEPAPLPAGNALVDTEPGRRPQLSPALLTGSPNPFHTVTRISFQIPATIGEAFLNEEGQDLQFDPQQRMPYADGMASVQVTIYGLEGREIATLFTGAAAIGTYETQWDGRDREGRPLASGTYFCKLQIDQWSVTRRLIFIR